MKTKHKTESVSNHDEAIKEAYRYLNNAKETIGKSSIEYGVYQDSKYVKEAAGIAYLSALKAIDGYLIGQGIAQDKLPSSYEGYWDAVIKKIPKNGKLRNALTVVYQNLHILAYYRGGVDVEMVKSGFTNAKKIIDMLA